MIEQGLYDYLTDTEDLTGHPAARFSSAQSIEGFTINNRNEARRILRDKIGREIYSNRRPINSSTHTAIVLRTIASGETYYKLSGEDTTTQSVIQVDVMTKGGQDAIRAQTVAKLIKLCVSGYHADSWGEYRIAECRVERISSFAETPPAAGDDWTFRTSMDLIVTYDQLVAAVYPDQLLDAAITWTLPAGESTELKVSASDSIIPEGRSLATVAWEVRVNDPDSAAVSSISGTAAMGVTEANITGTYASPAFDRTTFGLSSATVYLTLTVTDDTGGTDSAEANRDE